MPTCLWCSYDLTGLPEHHACPECGLEHDPQAIAIAVRTTEKLGLALSAAWILAALLCAQRGSARIFYLVMGGAAVLSYVANFWWLRGRTEQLIICSKGVSHCRKDGTIHRIPWQTVSTVYQSRITGNLVIKSPSPNSSLRVDVIKGPKFARKMVRYILDER